MTVAATTRNREVTAEGQQGRRLDSGFRDCRLSPVHVHVLVLDQCPISAQNSVYEYVQEYVYGQELSFSDSPFRRNDRGVTAGLVRRAPERDQRRA